METIFSPKRIKERKEEVKNNPQLQNIFSFEAYEVEFFMFDFELSIDYKTYIECSKVLNSKSQSKKNIEPNQWYKRFEKKGNNKNQHISFKKRR